MPTLSVKRGAANYSIGSLYLLMPELTGPQLDVEVRVLTVFSRIIGEIIERQRAAIHTANVSADIATFAVLKQEQFKAALEELLGRKSDVFTQFASRSPVRNLCLAY